MPVTVFHQLTATTPDDPAYEIRPSHFNESHLASLSILASEISGLFSNANGVSFGTSNGSITASYTQSTHTHRTEFAALTLGGNTAGTTTFNASNNDTLFLHGGSNITLSGNGSSVTIVGAAGGGGNFSAGVSDLGNTLGDTGITGTRLVFAGGNNVTLSQSTDANGATITVSGANAGGAQTGISGIQVSDTTYTSGTVTFRNANGISFGSSGANGVSASYTVPTVTNSSWTVSDNGTSGTVARLAFTNLNGVTLSLSTGAGGSHTIVGSHNALTSQSNQAVSGSNGSFTFQTVTFGSSNGMHFYTTNGSLVGSYTVPTVTNSSWTVSDNGTSGTVARLAFTNLNGVTLSLSTGAGGSHTIVGSHNALTSQSNQNVTASNGGFAFQTLSFSNANGISFGTSAGSAIFASHNGLTSQSNQAVSNSAGSFTFQTLNFSNANNVTWGTSAGGIVTASVAAPGAAAENNWHHALGANTSGNTTASGSTIGLSGINLTISGTNDSVLNLSVPATSSLVGASGLTVSTAGSTISVGAIPLSRWAPDVAITVAGSAHANSSVSLVPFRLENALDMSQIQFVVSATGATTTNNSSAGMQMSASVVLYTRNVSTLSSFNSGSVSFSAFYTSNATASFIGPRHVTVSFASSTMLTPGEYWLALHVSTTSAGQTNLGKTLSMGVVPTWQPGLGVINYFGSGMTNTRGPRPGLAIHSTGATRASIAFSDITGHSSNSASLANLWFALRNYTIW